MRAPLATLSIALALNAAAQEAPVTIVPFELVRGRILVDCTVNGVTGLRFLFDTGANVMVLNANSLHKVAVNADGETENIGSSGSNTVRTSAHNTFRFGTIEHDEVDFTLISYENAEFDGVWGANLMRDHVIEIDHDRNELRFYARSTYRNASLDHYEKFTITDLDGYPAIRSALVVEGQRLEGLFGIDTGADDLLTVATPFARQHGLATRLRQVGTATSVGSTGVPLEMPVVTLPELRLGEQRFHDLPILLSTAESGIHSTDRMAAYYGSGFLKRFNIILDLSRSVIHLRPNAWMDTPFE